MSNLYCKFKNSEKESWELNRKISIDAIDKLEKMAFKGIRFRLRDIVAHFIPEYFSDDERLFYLKRSVAKRWMESLKSRFKRKGVWYGSINKRNEYGFIITKEELIFVRSRQLRIVRGMIKEALVRIGEAKRNGWYDEK